jgi:CRISPR-associated protein Csx10
MTWFAVSLTFLSDWHVGTGAGRVGAIDACVHRDRYGLPVVPAKTLTGVWRDACETVAHVLDGTSPDASITGPWSRWVTALFGSAENADWMPALLAIGPARLPDDVAAVLRAYPSLRDALFVRRPGVAIDPCTGTAQENHLRLEERVTCGLTLVARAELLRVLPGTPLPEPAEFLLRAGARLVDALGGKRSRGAGRVALQMGPPAQLDEHGADARLLELLDRTAVLDAPGEPPALDDQVCDLAPGRLGSARRTVHRIALLAHTPVVIPDRLRGNLQTTHDRILGTAILPAVLQRIPEQLGLDDIRVTDAVPAVLVDGRYTPAHPAPLVWHRSDKGEGDVMLNVACTVPGPGSKAKPVRDRVVRVEGGGGQWSARIRRPHPRRDRRPGTLPGRVRWRRSFTFLGIPPGTVMVTDVGPGRVSPGLAPGAGSAAVP